MNTKKIPEREIQEDEQELLDHIWLSINDQPPTSETPGFSDVKQRINQKLRVRRMRRFGIASGAAVVLVAAALFFGQPIAPPATETYARLEQMGVTVDRPEVVLTTDDGMSITLDSAARIEHQTPGEMALHTASGQQTILSKNRKIKVAVPAGRQLHMTLADGSQVWLNAGSTLEYPASFDNNNERRVRLTGEAFFEVQKNVNKPFYVELDNNEFIRVIGTSFNVNAYTENGLHTTTLVTGKVCCGTPSGETFLLPNQQASTNCSSGKTTVCTVHAEEFAAWKEGWLWFEAEPLASLAARMSRIYGITITVDDQFRDYSFSGKIRTERGIGYILDLVSETTPITCEVTDGIIRMK